MTTIRTVALITAIVTSGLMAGLYAGFAYAVMPGLRQTSDQTFVDAMQRINVAILNGWFFIVFLGALIASAVVAVLHLSGGIRPVLVLALAGFVLYALTVVSTMTVNVPLNDQLLAAGSPERIVDLTAVRTAFEATWVRWNIARAVFGTAAFGCLVWALVLQQRAVPGP